MAKVVLIGLEQSAACQIGRALCGVHEIEQRPASSSIGDVPDSEVLNCDIVFANGEDKNYLPLLRNVRAVRPELPFVVVTRIPETTDWLDALEAGATDYCSAPFEERQMNWLVQSALGHQSLHCAAAA